MTSRLVLALVGFVGWGAAAGCTSDKPVKCVYREPKALAENAATMMADASLLPAGKDFVLAGIAGMNVSWAPVTAAGVAGAASTLTITETPVIAPRLAVTARATPGDQLVVVYGVLNAEMQIELHALTQVAGEAAAGPVLIKALPAGVKLADIRTAVGSSRTGQRALVAWAFADQPGTKIETITLGANAAAVGPAITMDAPEVWQCLQFVPSRLDWSLSWVRYKPSNSPKPWFVVEDHRDNDSASARYNVSLSTEEVSCPTVSPTDRGYLIGWQTKQGTWVTDYDIASSSVSGNFVAGAIRFGSPDDQPPVSGVASMGFDMAVTFGVKQGPQVWLFNAFGAHVGDELKLPSNKGAVGPVSTWPLQNAFYATYREGTTVAAPEGPRWFMKVECPAN
ncbi:MAG: hypothetical protein SF187_00725 [Deltaproteobacteria bacterium]|nr:hypothetical protein [Deltaproteobacteria bacterium]